MPTKEQEAWNEYLAQTRNLKDIRYEEVEPRQWDILVTRLGQIHRQKGKVGAKKAA